MLSWIDPELGTEHNGQVDGETTTWLTVASDDSQMAWQLKDVRASSLHRTYWEKRSRFTRFSLREGCKIQIINTQNIMYDYLYILRSFQAVKQSFKHKKVDP